MKKFESSVTANSSEEARKEARIDIDSIYTIVTVKLA